MWQPSKTGCRLLVDKTQTVSYMEMCFDTSTPQPLYNTVHYNMVLDITRISVGPKMII